MGVEIPTDPTIFLADYWQQKPLLMRQAVDPALFTLDANELAGLACEPEIESRLIVQQAASWQVTHGPFDADTFARLPEHDWTLLVQDVDKYDPNVADLLDLFDFLPAWRIDDIMISYATDGGGVGPHTDAYDVFLMQAAGQRRWRLSNRHYTDQDLQPNLDLRVLADFDVDEDWLLKPGDVLYLPPNIAHWGTAVGECMTYSLGFRAPTQRELAADWYQHVVSRGSNQVLGGTGSTQAASSVGLDQDIIADARGLVDALPGTGSAEFTTWLGCFLTEPKPQFQIDPPADPWTAGALAELLKTGRPLLRHPWARLTWTTDADGQHQLFGNGEPIDRTGASKASLEALCSHRRVRRDLFAACDQTHVIDLLLTLMNLGILEPDEG